MTELLPGHTHLNKTTFYTCQLKHSLFMVNIAKGAFDMITHSTITTCMCILVHDMYMYGLPFVHVCSC